MAETKAEAVFAVLRERGLVTVAKVGTICLDVCFKPSWLHHSYITKHYTDAKTTDA